MNKKAYVWLILLSLCVIQPAMARDVRFGLVQGLNFADIHIPTSDGAVPYSGNRGLYGIGGVFSLGLGSNFDLDFEPMYIRKTLAQPGKMDEPVHAFTLPFFEFSIFLKFSLGGRIQPYVKAGPTVGFPLHSRAAVDIAGVFPGVGVQLYKADLENILEKTDWSIMFASGVNFPLGKASGFLEGRYHFGLTDLWKSGSVNWTSGRYVIPTESGEDAKLFTRGFRVMLGINIPLGR